MPLETLIPPKILIVDDDALTASSLHIMLRTEGFSVFRTDNKDDVIPMMIKHKIDLVFVDLMMPKQTGFRVLKEIKNDDRIRKCPVIILTNLGHMHFIDSGLDLGASDYLLKSQVDTQDVVNIAKKYLLTHNARQSMRVS